ncbi:MAG: hypothetical protein DRJ38_04075 [Thermoprotei archaeon]|nr:MAG: hypothetical protein DRJ38_04075 [Thermoprotei archaeon]
MSKELKCPFCGSTLEKPYDHLIRKDVIDKRRYRVTYRCPHCKKFFSYVKTRKTRKYINKTDYSVSLRPVAEKVDIVIRRKKRKRTFYIEHDIFTKNAEVDHIGIEGLRGWKKNKTQFEASKGGPVEFVEKEYGKTTRRWKKKL